MTRLTCFGAAMVLVVAVMTSSLRAWARPTMRSIERNFDIGAAFGERVSISFEARESGCVLAWVSPWTSSGSGEKADQLALILNGSDRERAYARVDGAASRIAPLQLSYAVSAADASRVQQWTISVANFTERGTARGTIQIEYPPAHTPCAFRGSSRSGIVSLNWRYTGAPFNGDFIVERSRDGAAWSPVRNCRQTVVGATAYSCQDSDVQRGSRYYYRVCASLGNTACPHGTAVPLIRVAAR